jgi:beta-glucoside operon transcriptional antiterminator
MEIGNIALHLINAQTKDFNQTKENSRKIKDILTLIRINNKIELDSESLAYDRFITHLRFFFKRMNNRVNKNVENPLIKEVITRYPESYQTMKLIEEYLNVELNQDEQVYLCLHIQKLIENN